MHIARSGYASMLTLDLPCGLGQAKNLALAPHTQKFVTAIKPHVIHHETKVVAINTSRFDEKLLTDQQPILPKQQKWPVDRKAPIHEIRIAIMLTAV